MVLVSQMYLGNYLQGNLGYKVIPLGKPKGKFSNYSSPVTIFPDFLTYFMATERLDVMVVPEVTNTASEAYQLAVHSVSFQIY